MSVATSGYRVVDGDMYEVATLLWSDHHEKSGAARKNAASIGSSAMARRSTGGPDPRARRSPVGARQAFRIRLQDRARELEPVL